MTPRNAFFALILASVMVFTPTTAEVTTDSCRKESGDCLQFRPGATGLRSLRYFPDGRDPSAAALRVYSAGCDDRTVFVATDGHLSLFLQQPKKAQAFAYYIAGTGTAIGNEDMPLSKWPWGLKEQLIVACAAGCNDNSACQAVCWRTVSANDFNSTQAMDGSCTIRRPLLVTKTSDSASTLWPQVNNAGSVASILSLVITIAVLFYPNPKAEARDDQPPPHPLNDAVAALRAIPGNVWQWIVDAVPVRENNAPAAGQVPPQQAGASELTHLPPHGADDDIDGDIADEVPEAIWSPIE